MACVGERLEQWGRGRGRNETIDRVMLWGHETFSNNCKCKQEGCEFLHCDLQQRFLPELWLFWIGGIQKSLSVCWQVVVRGCIFCLVEVESIQKPYQRGTYECVCAHGHMLSTCEHILWLHIVWVCKETFPVWLVCQGCPCCRWQSCFSRTGSCVVLLSVLLLNFIVLPLGMSDSTA